MGSRAEASVGDGKVWQLPCLSQSSQNFSEFFTSSGENRKGREEGLQVGRRERDMLMQEKGKEGEFSRREHKTLTYSSCLFT